MSEKKIDEKISDETLELWFDEIRQANRNNDDFMIGISTPANRGKLLVWGSIPALACILHRLNHRFPKVFELMEMGKKLVDAMPGGSPEEIESWFDAHPEKLEEMIEFIRKDSPAEVSDDK